MNFVTLASLLLVFSTTVLAFPQEREDEINGLPGGFHKSDINAPEINDLAKKVLTKKFAGDSGSGCIPRINQVLEAATKIVAGSIVRIKLEICPDTCSNNAAKATDCKVCTLEAWEKPWENFLEIQKFEC